MKESAPRRHVHVQRRAAAAFCSWSSAAALMQAAVSTGPGSGTREIRAGSGTREIRADEVIRWWSGPLVERSAGGVMVDRE